jgi:signal transduction histidine kinase
VGLGASIGKRAGVIVAVLHNVGNVLNSVNVSTNVLTDRLRGSSFKAVGKVAQLLTEHQADLAHFFGQTPKGQQLVSYVTELSNQLAREECAALEELVALNKNVDHIKKIVAMQQSYARVGGVTTPEDVGELLEDALRMNQASLEGHRVSLVRDFQKPLPTVIVDRHAVMQIFLNLISNARHACEGSQRVDKQVTVRVSHDGQRIRIAVIDNGIGIPAENLTRIFNHGFTAGKNGPGFGLHSGALAAKQLGGELRAQSDGPGRGATFVLELRMQAPAEHN